MAFPTIPTTGAGTLLTTTQANTTATRTFPSLSSLTKSSGDLLIAVVVAYQSSAAAGSVWSSWGGGFTEFKDVGGGTSSMTVGCAYKFSTGSESGTFSVTQAATVTGHAALILMNIVGAHVSSPPEASSIATGTSSAADPDSLAPSWGADETLWIDVVGAGETGTGGAFQGISGAGGFSPTNYGSEQASGISADVVGGVEGGVTFQQLNASSEDVGPASVDVSNARNCAVVVAVRPFIPVAVPPGILVVARR